jgi:hypothetical protein
MPAPTSRRGAIGVRNLETTVTPAKVTGSHITAPQIHCPSITSARIAGMDVRQFTGGKIDRVTTPLQRIAPAFTGATKIRRVTSAWPVWLLCFRWLIDCLTRLLTRCLSHRHQPQLIIGLSTIDQPLLKRLNRLGEALSRHQFPEVTRTRYATVEFSMGAGEAFARGKVLLVLADRPIDKAINPALQTDHIRQLPDRRESIKRCGNHTRAIRALHSALKLWFAK